MAYLVLTRALSRAAGMQEAHSGGVLLGRVFVGSVNYELGPEGHPGPAGGRRVPSIGGDLDVEQGLAALMLNCLAGALNGGGQVGAMFDALGMGATGFGSLDEVG